jgi:membrane-associated phospholipid phosphatase
VSSVSHTARHLRAGGDFGAAPRAARALQAACLCAVALALVWVVAELVPAAHVRDALLLRHFTLLSGPRVDAVAAALLDLLEPLPLAALGAALVVFGVVRGRPREAAAAAAIVLLSPVSADLLKPLLAHPHAHAGSVHIGSASWPSGHSAAALALALAATLLAPRRARPAVAALGCAFALAVGGALLTQAWHMPSDVLGGYLIAALWTALAVAALRAAGRSLQQQGQTPEPGPLARDSGVRSARARAVRAGLPQRLSVLAPALRIGRAAEDEQQVGKPVEVANHLGV